MQPNTRESMSTSKHMGQSKFAGIIEMLTYLHNSKALAEALDYAV